MLRISIYINAGPDDAVATLTIPTLPNSTVVLASDPGNGCVIGLNEVTCSLTLPALASTDVTIVKTYQAAGNYAEVLNVSGNVPDPNPGDNKATFTALIQ